MIKNFNSCIEYIKNNKKDITRCILRCDLNIPSDIEDLSRIHAIKETVDTILELGLHLVLISHYKRPSVDDIFNPKFSLQNVVKSLESVLNKPVEFVRNSIFDIEPQDISYPISLLENLRFYEGETKDDDELAARLAMFGDIFINDAFSVSHRKHASVVGITRHLPSFAGAALSREVAYLSMLRSNVERPYTAIIGGAKVSSKIDVLNEISKTADTLIISGAMANTFLAAKGIDMQCSLVEPELFELCIEILENAKAKIILPVDFSISKDINSEGTNSDDIPEGFSCFDIGKQSIQNIVDALAKSRTVLWNGALGAFEFANFNQSSNIISKFIAENTKNGKLLSIIGGGETVASINSFKNDMTFVSTAGGAFLEFISKDSLPGIKSLSEN